MTDRPMRVALPSKGRLSQRALELFELAGLRPAFAAERALVASLGDDFEAIFVRAEDIPEIFQRYFLEYARRYQRPNLKVEADVLEALKARPWPGNVRELRNYAERLALLAPDQSISTKTLPDLGAAPEASTDDIFGIDNFETFKNAAEKAYLERKLAEAGWNIKQTAEKLGMQRSNLYKKIERYALRSPAD